jgi:hypothetical protein
MVSIAVRAIIIFFIVVSIYKVLLLVSYLCCKETTKSRALQGIFPKPVEENPYGCSYFGKNNYLCIRILKNLNSATVSINRLSDSKLSLWCLGALFDCCISRDKPFHPLTPQSDLRQYAVENRQEIRISQSLY